MGGGVRLLLGLYLHNGLGDRLWCLCPLLRKEGVEEEEAAQGARAVVGGEGAEGSEEGLSPGREPG